MEGRERGRVGGKLRGRGRTEGRERGGEGCGGERKGKREKEGSQHTNMLNCHAKETNVYTTLSDKKVQRHKERKEFLLRDR